MGRSSKGFPGCQRRGREREDKEREREKERKLHPRKIMRFSLSVMCKEFFHTRPSQPLDSVAREIPSDKGDMKIYRTRGVFRDSL